MHIPDGFLDPKTALATGILAAAGLAVALRQTHKNLPRKQIPLLGLSAAFVFTAQMLNFPVAGGTSGHLIGAVLTAALLGPSAAVIVISCVLIVQCFMFADGGITTLGANIFNMALVGGVGGWTLYHLLTRIFPGLFGRILGATFAAWASTVLASIACAGQLAASGTVTWSLAFPTIAGIHALIGIGEGLITALVLAAIARTRPDLLGLPPETCPTTPSRVPCLTGQGPEGGRQACVDQPSAEKSSTPPSTSTPAPQPYASLLAYGLLITLGLALFISPLASTWPDGLDRAAQSLGFHHLESTTRPLPAPAPDYKIPGLPSGPLATSLTAALGSLLVFTLSYLLAHSLTRQTKSNPKH